MEGRDEVLQDWKDKFLNTYKVSLTAGVIYTALRIVCHTPVFVSLCRPG